MRPGLWSRLYGDLVEHEKFTQAIGHFGGDHGDAFNALCGFWLYLACHTTRNKGDGFISDDTIARAPGTHANRALNAFLTTGILDVAERGTLRGVRIHNWLARNISAERFDRRKEVERAKKANWRKSKMSTVDMPRESTVESPQTTRGTKVDTRSRENRRQVRTESEESGNSEQKRVMSRSLSTVDTTRDSTVDKTPKINPKREDQDRQRDHAENGDRGTSQIEAQKAGQGRTELKSRIVAHPRAALPRPAVNGNGHGKTEPPIPICPHAAKHGWCSVEIRWGFCVEMDQHQEFIERGMSNTELIAFYAYTVGMTDERPPAKRYEFWRKHAEKWLRTPRVPVDTSWYPQCQDLHGGACGTDRELHRERVKDAWTPEWERKNDAV